MIFSSSDMDIEDKLKHLKMRIQSYLQGGTPAAHVDYSKLKSEYHEYCALCSLVGGSPIETIPEKVAYESKRLMAKAEKQEQEAYIMDSIETIISTLGCHVKDQAVLDHVDGQIFSVEGHPLCDVFIGADNSGIMFEPIIQSREGSLDKRRQEKQSADSICSMYSEIEEMAAEKGIILKRIYAEPVELNSMYVQSDLKVGKDNRQQNIDVVTRPEDYLWE